MHIRYDLVNLWFHRSAIVFIVTMVLVFVLPFIGFAVKKKRSTLVGTSLVFMLNTILAWISGWVFVILLVVKSLNYFGILN